MAFLNWDASFEVGIMEVDRQHRSLFDLTNDLHDAMRAGQGKQVLGKVLDALVAYTKNHFGYEERMLGLYRYGELAAHKSQHEALVQQVQEFQQKYTEGNATISISLMNTLRNWLTNHIKVSDAQYAAFLREKGVR
jgi:hemerythrin